MKIGIRMGILFIIYILMAACEDQLIRDESISGPSLASEMLEAVNHLRSEGCYCGSKWMGPVASLSWNDKLERAATRHVIDMERNDFFSHTGSDGSSSAQRVNDSGYRWRAVGENIAWGYSSVQKVVVGWKNSPGHCRNIMDPGYTEMGAAHYQSYWAQTLASPR
ncbi:MAG: CAP domain-containing protein [Saprospiraceae bacterium]|nr:CAP domain-containing protein [Saprospiraceae bacterium]